MGIRKVLLVASVPALLLAITFASYENPERDRLLFVDSLDTVQRNAMAMDALLKQGYGKCDQEYHVAFKLDAVEVYHSNPGDASTLEYFCDSANVPMAELKRISGVLSRNGITGVYRQYGTDVSVFQYRELENQEFASVRDIIIDEGDNRKIMLSYASPMDKKGKLILMH